jgi:hypothetical protein
MKTSIRSLPDALTSRYVHRHQPSARDLTGRVGVRQLANSSQTARTVLARFRQHFGYDLSTDELNELTSDADFSAISSRLTHLSVSLISTPRFNLVLTRVAYSIEDQTVNPVECVDAEGKS